MDEERSARDRAIIEQCLRHFKEADDADAKQRQLRQDDLRFANGDSDNMSQWPAALLAIRQRPGKPPRPCITDNRLAGQIRQVTNEQRQNKPSIKCRPVDDYGDKEVAKIYDGYIRSIEDESDADTAYTKAGDYQAVAGIGYFRVVTEYESPLSFNQAIRIRPVVDPDRVRMDPYIQTREGSDQRYCIIFDDVPLEDFKRDHPDITPASWPDVTIGTGWVNDDSIRVAEYFCVKTVPFWLYRLDDGTVTDELPRAVMELMGGEEETEALLARLGIERRRSAYRQVYWYKCTAFAVLEERIFESQYIPVLRVVGEEWIIDGERVTHGMTRKAKDPQRMVNWWTSAESEMVALQPKAPWVAARGQVEAYQDMWDQANVDPVSVLIYDHVVDPTTGVAAPPPQRAVPPMMAAAFAQGKLGAVDSLKAATNVYDASLGQRSNETSGIAIQRRDVQQETSNYHYLDNLAVAIKHCGRIIIDMIPRVISGREAIRVLGEDGAESIARLQWSDSAPAVGRDDRGQVYNLGRGRYDVTVTVGPSFSTKRQEAAAFMTEAMRAAPQLLSVAGDLLFGSLDVPGSDRLAERLKKTLPPNLLDEPDADPKQQLMQAQSMIQQMEQALQNADQIVSKIQEAAAKLQQENDGLRVQLKNKADEIELKRDELVLRQREIEEDSQEQAKLMAQQIDLMLQKHMLDVQRVVDGLARDDTVDEQQAQQAAQAIDSSNEALAAAVQSLAQALAAPKRIVRDEAGRPDGVETVL